MKRWLSVGVVFLWAVLVPLGALAQDAAADTDSQGYLERLLQDSLSDAGRDVHIQGFSGALSSRATIARLTISDEDGVWLDAKDLALDWSRAALLRGRLEVNELSADSISMPRKPMAEAGTPTPEATPFTLPDLPVAVNVAQVSIRQVDLGANILGQSLSLSVNGSAQLENGGGRVAIDAKGVGDHSGTFKVDLGYQPGANTASIQIAVAEDAEGIIAGLIGLPERPSIDLQVSGAGPVDRLTVDVALKTDQALRLGGQVTLRGTAMDLDLGGDMRALVDETYHPLLGDDARLRASAERAEDGTITIERLALASRAADLTGDAVIAPSGLPQRMSLRGDLRDPDGVPLVLAPDVTINGAMIDLRHDADQGQDWQGTIALTGLEQDALHLPRVVLTGTGQIAPATDDTAAVVSARFDFATTDLAMRDSALQALLGPTLRGGLTLRAEEAQPLEISDLVLDALGFDAAGSVRIDGLDSGYSSTLALDVALDDLGHASALSGYDLGGAAQVALTGQVTPLSGAFDLRATGKTVDLRVGDPLIDGLAGGGGALNMAVRRDETGLRVDTMQLTTDGLRIAASGGLGSAESALDFDAIIPDFARLGENGAGRATLTGRLGLTGAEVSHLDVSGTLGGPTGLRLPIGTDVLALSEGRIAINAAQGRWRIETLVSGLAHGLGRADAVDLTGVGTYAQTDRGGIASADGALKIAVHEAKLADPALAQALGGAVALETTFEYAAGAPLVLDPLRVTGDGYGMAGQVSVLPETGVATVAMDLSLGDAARFSALAGRRLGGAADLRMTGTIGATDQDITLTGRARGLDLGDPHINGVLAGTLDIDTHVVHTSDTTLLDHLALTGGNLTLTAQGRMTPDGKSLTADAQVGDLSRLVPEFPGAVRVRAQIGGDADTTTLDVSLSGPVGIDARVQGAVDAAGAMNITAQGGAPLGLANPMIAPRQVSGEAQFDLALRGQPSLNNISGTLSIAGGRVSDPVVGLSLSDLAATARLAGGRVQLDASAQGSEGGGLSIAGSLGANAPYETDITVSLNDLVLRDPSLYEITTQGDVTFSGPALNGGQLRGRITLPSAEIRIPETGAGAAGSIPDIVHIGASAGVRETRADAGLILPETDSDTSVVAIPLDLTISAPARLFVRGRGLDAELGGQIRLRGTTADIIPVGRFDLVRGRLDLLGQRFDFDEGFVSLEGALVPVMRFVVATESGDVTTFIIVEGAASAPEVSFSSSPELPEDEVLAQLLFGQNMTRLSAFQALQLANAVAVLAGRGGEGIVSKLRQGFALDDLDVTTDDQGNAAVRAGKYLTDDIYTDVTLGAAGQTELNLNIDISNSITARGGVDASGDSSIGLFFERDY